MNVFPEELSKAYPEDHTLLILDNAAWHHSSALVAPGSIDVFPLLSYTSELNPVETIRDEVREKGFRNKVFKCLEAIIDRLCRTVKDPTYDDGIQLADMIDLRGAL